MKDLAEYLVTYGCQQGADEIEVSIQHGSEFSVEVRFGEIERLIQAGSRYVALRLIKDKKTAFATSSDLDKNTLQELVKNAIKRAALANPDEFSGLPALNTKIPDLASLQLYDEKILKLTSEEKINLAKKTEELALQDKRIANSHGASFETRNVTSFLCNSKGFSHNFSETLVSLGLGLQAGETDNIVEDYWSSTKRHISDLDPPELIANRAVERTVRQLNPKKIRTQSVPVIFEKEMTSWLLGFLFACISGIAIYNRASFLVDKLNTQIGNDLVTVFDDGLLPKKLGTGPFDSEGVPSQKTTVVHKGILNNYLCNTYAARRLGLDSTGNASGNGVGPSNFYMQAGSSSMQDMISSLEKGLVLIRVLGHGLNPLTGDLSRGAFGLWVENGEIVYPVSEITISGNLGSILNQVEMLGSDLDFRSPVSGPSLKIRELLIAGT